MGNKIKEWVAVPGFSLVTTPSVSFLGKCTCGVLPLRKKMLAINDPDSCFLEGPVLRNVSSNLPLPASSALLTHEVWALSAGSVEKSFVLSTRVAGER